MIGKGSIILIGLIFLLVNIKAIKIKNRIILKRNTVNVVLHIPHSSLYLPKKFYKQTLLSKTETNCYAEKFADLAADKIYRTKYNRIYCDVERFVDDNLNLWQGLGGASFTRELMMAKN